MSAEQASLFDVERTFSVGELTAAIGGALRRAFPDEVWVRGELQGRRETAGGHLYFSLHERGRGRAPAVLAVACFARERRRVERELAGVPAFALTEGVEVRVRGRLDLWAPAGRLQLILSAVDPLHTLGRLAAARDRTLRALAAEGLLDANARRALPVLPLRVGLITSDGSAACADFLHELEAAGLGFRVDLVDARVQGAAAERTLLGALAVLARRRPDVICIVRGGGARTDLVAFDSERLARAVAACPVPVLTGIGHEIDTSVLDAVAHRACKTPTACAAVVVERVRAATARAEAAWAAVAERARAATTAAEGRLASAQPRLRAGAARAVATRSARVDGAAGRVQGVTRWWLADADRRLDRFVDRLAGWRRALGRAEAALELAAARAAGADPARVLARGYSVTRTADGRLVRAAGEVSPGDQLVTTLGAGSVRSRVEASGAGWAR